MSSARRFQPVAVSIAATAIVLSGLLSACSTENGAPSKAAATAAHEGHDGHDGHDGHEGPKGPAPAIAKTQGWLKIYNGAAPVETAYAIQLNATRNPKVGRYVSDGTGRSLYRFDKDTAQPSISNCVEQCAATWPPLTVARDQSLYVVGVDAQLIGFIERADGTCQITIGGWPVYYFSNDKDPGDLLGQGVGNTWFAVAPNGAKAS